ncbi:hypothetical protein AB0E96_29265 [Kitasatospora sp. NPDC036755]|uniref:hypothetical protein n=1 Tax=Kitasatospora sp. NPDC036755 TaxID=3154600 RepID=UPI003411B8FB
MRIPRGLAAPVLACSLALAGAVTATPAGSAELRPLPLPAVQYCAAVLGHVPGAGAASQDLGRACASDYRAEQLAEALRDFGDSRPADGLSEPME